MRLVTDQRERGDGGSKEAVKQVTSQLGPFPRAQSPHPLYFAELSWRYKMTHKDTSVSLCVTLPLGILA